MPQESRNISTQLDEPPEQAARPEPPDPAAAEDLSDSIDDLLSEAGRPADGKDGAAPEPAGDHPPSEADRTLQQIDEMLAEHAEESLAGDFEPGEDVAGEIEDAAEPPGDDPNPDTDAVREPAGSADAEPPEDKAPSMDRALDDMLDGDAESAEQAGDPPGPAAEPSPAEADTAAPEGEIHEDRPPTGEAEAVDQTEGVDARPPDPPPSSETTDAEAVASELDAEAEEMHRPSGDKSHEPAAEADPPAKQPPSPPRSPSLRGPLVAALAAVNRPTRGLSRQNRNVMGFIGLETIFVAVALVVHAWFGPVATLTAAGPLMLLLTAAFYGLFLRKTAAPPTPPATEEE